ncbi:hypothetical protein JX266_008708 [Neoarthrinium moseri]|nr:hypothetical protein JX266_008708 [Neoarthrinium moseri]
MAFENPRATPQVPAAAKSTSDPVILTRQTMRDGGSGSNTDIESSDPPRHTSHPRDGLAPWRWKAMICGNMLLSAIGGYDTSNVANIQVPIYQAFGHIELLPWVSLTYALSSVAVIPLVRKVIGLCNLKILALVSCVLASAGSALAGAAPNLECVIVGRVLMAVGSVAIYQTSLSYNVIFAYPSELALVQALVGVFFALGLISGPIIGGAFAENETATWRWAFFVVLPVTALAAFLLLFYPPFRMPTTKSTMTRVREVDWVGLVLWIGLFVLFGLGSISSGSAWAWDSGPSITVWVLFGVTLLVFAIQQRLNLFTVPERRAFPVFLLTKRAVALPSLCLMFTAIGYGTTLYYTPLYFAFTRGHDALGAALRLLPFIGVFIFMIFLSGGLLPVLRYYMPFYVAGAFFVLVGGGLQQTITPQTSEGTVMGFEAIVAAGFGLMWQTSLPISSIVLPPQERMDAVSLFAMAQLGGVSIGLALSGAVYQNVGFNLVKTAVADLGFSDHDIRELLSGADSPILTAGNQDLLALVVAAITKALLRCFYLTLSAGALCFIAACFMRFEALNFKKAVPGSKSSPANEK